MPDVVEPKQQGELLHHAIEARETEVEALITTARGLVEHQGRDQAVYSMAKYLGATLNPGQLSTLLSVALRALAEVEPKGSTA